MPALARNVCRIGRAPSWRENFPGVLLPPELDYARAPRDVNRMSTLVYGASEPEYAASAIMSLMDSLSTSAAIAALVGPARTRC